MTAEVRKALLCKGIPLDKGYRGIGSEKVFQMRQAKEEFPEEQRVVQSDEDEQVAHVSRSHAKGRGKVEPKHPEQKCFGCGEQGHFIRTCPDKKKCTSCGRWGHRASYCRDKSGQYYASKTSRSSRDVYQVSGSEEAVTLKVMIEGQEVAAMLDTGATPCVIDKSTADNLGLCRRLVHERSKVYGLCNNAVQVLGHVMAAIKVGTLEPVIQKVQVLNSEEPTVLLGRQFMKRLGTVTLDFLHSRIKLGNVWEQYEATVQGATPLARAQVAKQEEELEKNHWGDRSPLINPKLSCQNYERLKSLAEQFDIAFARNHRKSSRTRLPTQHAIITEEALPQKSRPRRVPPKWEEEISRQLEEMLATDPADNQT